jgi:hypothetical protein
MLLPVILSLVTLMLIISAWYAGNKAGRRCERLTATANHLTKSIVEVAPNHYLSLKLIIVELGVNLVWLVNYRAPAPTAA